MPGLCPTTRTVFDVARAPCKASRIASGPARYSVGISSVGTSVSPSFPVTIATVSRVRRAGLTRHSSMLNCAAEITSAASSASRRPRSLKARSKSRMPAAAGSASACRNKSSCFTAYEACLPGHAGLKPRRFRHHRLAPRGIEGELDIDLAHGWYRGKLFLDVLDQDITHAASRRGQRHRNAQIPRVVFVSADFALVDQSQIDDVDRDLRIVAAAHLLPCELAHVLFSCIRR